MTEAVLARIWAIAVADPVLIGLFAHPDVVEPRFYLRMAPDEPTFPYVVYNLVPLGAGGGGDVIWPMADYTLEFLVYDYIDGRDETRIFALAQRLLELFSLRGYDVDPTKAGSVRTYEGIGPTQVDTSTKLVPAYSVRFQLRGLDKSALVAKVARDR